MRKILLFLWCSLFLLNGELFAQTRTLTGKITDANGNPIPNASVLVKGTRVGTVTNTDGVYSLNAPQGAKTLIISSINMQTEEIKIGTGTEYNLTLKSLDASLQEVVVTGYSTIAKRSLTGSVAKISGDAVTNKPVLSFDQALAGKAAGVMINTSSGLVGDNVLIRIRGAASISSGSQPLIVIDGVPVTQGDQGQLYNPANALADINPNDIENVEVLKDAAATAIYGSRGSAGVILITTKKGKAGVTSISVDSYAGFNEPMRKMKVLSGPDYITVMNKMGNAAGLGNIAKYGDIDGDGKPDTTNTDWQKAAFRKGLVQNHQISLSGGSGKTTYYASLNYNDFENYIDVNAQKRGSARLNLTSKATDWLTIGINTQYSRTKSYGLGSGTGGALSGIPYGPLTAQPNLPIHNPDGTYYTGRGGNTITSNTPNPVAVQHLNYDNRDDRRFLGSAYGEAELIKGLKFKSQINIDYLTAYNDNYWNPLIGDGKGFGLGQTVYSEGNTWSWSNTLNYNVQIGADHELNALAGAEYTRWKGSYAYASGSGIKDPDFRIINSSNYDVVSAQNDVVLDNGLASYFGALNYGFRKKYLASVNMRADADSRFSKKYQWGYFPSGSLAWRVSEEDFMRTVSFVNDLKLRASYGVTGNSNIGYFPALRAFVPATYADLGAYSFSNPGNSLLRWERHLQFDVGIDAVLWKNTNVTLEYYNRKTKDLILDDPVLATLGFPGNTVKENVGELRSRGIEASVSTPALHTKNFDWTVNFNIAWNNNKVLKTNPNGDDLFDASGTVWNLARPGQDLSTYYLIRWAGVDPANGLPMFLDVNGNTKEYDAATKKWTDTKNGTSTSAITANDRVLLKGKTPYPKFYGGLSQQFTYKSFDASVDLQYALGFYVYDNTLQTLESYTNNKNKSIELLGAWSSPGQNTNVPRLFYNDNQWAQNSTRWLEKGDFVRVRNIQVGYSMPKSIISKAKINKLRFYVQLQNVYTFTGYKGIDPEANGYGNTNIGLGIDRIRPYLPRTYTLGINLGL